MSTSPPQASVEETISDNTTPGYVSNAALAARLSALVDKWNQYKNALRDMLTKSEGTVDMEDGTGAIVTLMSFPSLQKLVTALADTASGAAAGAQSSASAAAMSAADAERSEVAAGTSADAAKLSENAAAASQAAAAAAESNAVASDSRAAESSASASSSASNAAASRDSAESYADNAGFSAASAQSSSLAASGSANTAQQYANAPVNVQIAPGQYSAFHWSEQARLNAMGSLVYKGQWDASNGSYPTKPALGDFYLISVNGVMGGVSYSNGDMMLYDGAKWDRVDNQQTVTSVQGRIGSVTLSWSDLGYTPVQLGTGIGQSTNAVKIGWAADGSGKLKVTVDESDRGNVAMESWVKGNYFLTTGGTVSGFTTFSNRVDVLGDLNGTMVLATDAVATGSIANGGNGGLRGLVAHANNNGTSSATSSATITLIRDGKFGCYFGIDTDNILKVGGWSYGNVAYRVVHEGISNPSFATPVYASEMRATGANGLRISQGNRGMMWRFDGGSSWLLFTNDGDPWGNFTTLRPFQAEWSTGNVTMAHSVSVGGNLSVGNQLSANSVQPTPNALIYNENNGMTLRVGNGSVGYRYYTFNGNNGDLNVMNGWVYANNFKINSDARLKSNRVFLDPREELENLKKLAACVYDKNGHREYGFFAQEFESVYPTMVTKGDGLAGPDTRAITFGELLSPIVAAIQHLDQRLSDAGL
jgi:hypothetical protein